MSRLAMAALALLTLGTGCSSRRAPLAVVEPAVQAGPARGRPAPGLTVVVQGRAYTAPADAASDRELFIEVPANSRVNLNWFVPPDSAFAPFEFRWALDPEEPGRGRGVDHGRDDPPGLDPHASGGWSPIVSSITIGPFAGGETHVVVIEVRGRRGYHASVTFHIQVVQSSFKRDLLIVDDTRFPGDELGVGGCVRAPRAHGPRQLSSTRFSTRAGEPHGAAIHQAPRHLRSHRRDCSRDTRSTPLERSGGTQIPRSRSPCSTSIATWSGSPM